MKNLLKISFVLSLLFMFNCTGTIKPLGYFSLFPYSNPAANQNLTTLNILLGDDVKNDFSVKSTGIKEMQVRDFRKSVESSLINTFQENYKNIRVCETISGQGLTLTVYRIRPFWKLEDIFTPSETLKERYVVSAGFQIDAALFLNGKKIKSVVDTIYSDEKMTNTHQAHNIFKNGFEKVCETINHRLFI